MSSYTGLGMKIGELARRSGLAATALRYYEKAGLLPEPVRTASGYRAYTADVLQRLAFIRAAQAVGLTVGEIRDVIGIRDLGRAPCAHVLELIERRRDEVRSRIRELQQLERDLTVIAEQGAGLDPADCDPAGICKIIPSEVALRPDPPGQRNAMSHRRDSRQDRSHLSVARRAARTGAP